MWLANGSNCAGLAHHNEYALDLLTGNIQKRGHAELLGKYSRS
jgi:hypothetical protein